MRDIEHGCASMTVKKLLEITVAFGLTLETLYYGPHLWRKCWRLSIFDVSAQRDRKLYQPFPCITCGLAICGTAGMAVRTGRFWSESPRQWLLPEGRTVPILESVAHRSLTEKPSPVQILIYDVVGSVSAQYFRFYIRKPCSLIQIRKPQHFWYVHMITSIKKESAKEDSGLLSWIPSRRLSKHL